MATYVVTGGCGFIGSHLADALIKLGHAIRIIDKLVTGRLSNMPANAQFMHGNVSDANAMTGIMQGADGCFHLAAVASVERSNPDWIGAHCTNLTGTINKFDAARRTNLRGPIPVVYSSTAAVFGNDPDILLAEEAALRPLSAHGANKLGCGNDRPCFYRAGPFRRLVRHLVPAVLCRIRPAPVSEARSQGRGMRPCRYSSRAVKNCRSLCYGIFPYSHSIVPGGLLVMS